MKQRSRPTAREQYDGPWKSFLELHFPQLIEFFVPEAYLEIDWERKPVSLNTELRRLRRGNATGDKRADALFQVFLKTGEERRVLVHVEVQSTRDRGLPLRMFEYCYRAWDRHRQKVAGLAILADTGPSFRPDHFGWDLWGSKLSYSYPVIKLLDYRKQWRQLEQSRNVFAVATMAQLKTKATRHDPEARLAWKRKLMRLLYERRYTREEITSLFHLIDWMMQLPEKQEIIFETDLASVEAEFHMPYVSAYERRAEARGEVQGRLKMLRAQLEHRFGQLPAWAAEQLGQASAALLDAWAPRVLDARRLEDVFAD